MSVPQLALDLSKSAQNAHPWAADIDLLLQPFGSK